MAASAVVCVTGGGCRDGGPAPLRVMAASSLTEAMAELAAEFEADHPGVRVELQLAGSQALRLQIEHGAAADLFASAALTHLERLNQAGLAGPPTVFAENALVVVTPKGRSGPTVLEELGSARGLVVGAPEVPVGAYTRAMLAELGKRRPELARAIRAAIVSEESNVRLVRAKVELGEADAAVVYRSDALAAQDRLRWFPLPDEIAPRPRYGAAVIGDSSGGAVFLEWLTSPAARAILGRHGFRAPK